MKMPLAEGSEGIFVRALSVGVEGEMETYSVRVLHYLNGNKLCTLEECGGRSTSHPDAQARQPPRLAPL